MQEIQDHETLGKNVSSNDRHKLNTECFLALTQDLQNLSLTEPKITRVFSKTSQLISWPSKFMRLLTGRLSTLT